MNKSILCTTLKHQKIRKCLNYQQKKNITLFKFSIISEVKILYFLLVVIFIFSSCASLTKSQLKEVNEFGKLTKDFSAYPSKLYNSYLDIHEKALLYSANAMVSPSAHYAALASANNLKRTLDTINPKLDLTYKIIDKYAQTLLLLTDDRHLKSFDTASGPLLGTSLNGLVRKYNSIYPAQALPANIGTTVSNIIAIGGGYLMHHRQAKIVKEMVPKADTLIGQLTTTILIALQGLQTSVDGKQTSFHDMLQDEKQNVENSYKFFLGLHRDLLDVSNLTDSTSRFKGIIQQQRFATVDNDRDCLQMLAGLDELDKLYIKTIKAIENLRRFHKEIANDLLEKKNLKEFTEELQVYSDDINEMQSIFNSIK